MTNRYGLSREIDEGIKQAVRKRDGFGCVHCGIGIVEYHHFNPPFVEATAHSVDGIALLCPNCHSCAEKGILSTETIQDDVKNPCCRRKGYANNFWDLKFPALVHFGNFIYYASKDKTDHVILRVNNELTLGCSADAAGGPIQLSAIFRDKENQICLQIIKNEWMASPENWDVRQVGNKLNIYEGQRKVGIEIRAVPPHDIYFTSLATYFNGNKLFIDKQGASIHRTDGSYFSLFTDGPIRRSAPIYVCHRPITNDGSKIPGRIPLPQDPVIIYY